MVNEAQYTKGIYAMPHTTVCASQKCLQKVRNNYHPIQNTVVYCYIVYSVSSLAVDLDSPNYHVI